MTPSVELTRQVRFSLRRGVPPSAEGIANSWAGWPAADGLSPFLTLDCRVAAALRDDLDYVCNIKEIDRAVRERVIAPALARGQTLQIAEMSFAAFSALQSAFHPAVRLVDIVLWTTPFLRYSVKAESPRMLHITQQFEFSASHRLHNPSLSDEENRGLYGKCNNPLGHGHNYLVDVTFSYTEVPALDHVERVVKETVIDPLDHKYLNMEVAAFRDVIPSVENIAVVIWDWLDGKLSPAELRHVRVYETPKTWADYNGR